jgi:hypothetical protein
MIKKGMCALTMVLLVVVMAGCPVAEQLLKTRLQGEWEWASLEDDHRITLTFDDHNVSQETRIVIGSIATETTLNGTYDVVDTDNIVVTWANSSDSSVWRVEFFGGKRTLAVTNEDNILNAEVTRLFSRVSFR